VGIALLVVVAAATGIVDILDASLVGALALLAFGVLSPTEMRGVIDLNVLVVIASSFGLGAAILETGLADKVADGLISGLEGFGHWAILLGVILVTVALTETVTNNAAAVLMFPIALAVADHVGGDPRGYAMAVAVVASASFLTPIGYQTNTMVWGPGGYRFTDYARLGAPITLVTVVIALLATTHFYGI